MVSITNVSKKNGVHNDGKHKNVFKHNQIIRLQYRFRKDVVFFLHVCLAPAFPKLNACSFQMKNKDDVLSETSTTSLVVFYVF